LEPEPEPEIREKRPAVVAAPSTPANDPQEIIHRLKDATVYLKNKVNGHTVSSGTGFVIETRGDVLTLATNRHVAVVDIDELPESIAPKGSKVQIDAVIRSGEGPLREQLLPARIVAADFSEDLNSDLAILQVSGVKQPPTPINPLIRFDLSEGMTYIAAGFPLGGIVGRITESRGNPSVAITGGRISALRRDDQGILNVIQVDGSLQPGNSGGPILDEKTGRLIGLAVAKVNGVDTIGFVVPAEQLRRVLAGRVGALDLSLQNSPQGTADLSVRAQLVNPKGTLKGVVVHAAPLSAGAGLRPNPDGSWPPLPNTTPVELHLDANSPTASGRVQLSLSGQGPESRKVLIQTAHRDFRDQLVYGKPREVELPEKPGRILPPGAFQRVINVLKRRSLAKLGDLVDPDKDCKLSKDDKTMRVSIDVPAKLHTLAPEIATKKNSPLHNAPMALTEIEGDFLAIVEVVGDIRPGSSPPSDPRGRRLPFTVQSAGLLLYQDKNNFMRLERAGSVQRDLSAVHRLIIEVVRDGKQARPPIYLDVPESSATLFLVRHKGRVRCLYSPNNAKTIYVFQELELDFPNKVKIGLTAANVSTKPFTASFANFALIDDAGKIEAFDFH
jgi:S1-C subfamily serine protease